MPNPQAAYVKETRLSPWLPGYCIADMDSASRTTFIVHNSSMKGAKYKQLTTSCTLVTGIIYKAMILSKF